MAKVLSTANTTHSFKFIPRFEVTGALSLYLKSEATGTETLIASTHLAEKNDLIEITFDSTFTENDKYQIRILEGSEVAYRGKLIVTSQIPSEYKLIDGFITY